MGFSDILLSAIFFAIVSLVGCWLYIGSQKKVYGADVSLGFILSHSMFFIAAIEIVRKDLKIDLVSMSFVFAGLLFELYSSARILYLRWYNQNKNNLQ